MSTALDFMNDLLSLPRSDRSYLASKLIESLEGGDALSEEQIAEYDNRFERWKSGEETAMTREQMDLEVEKMLNK